MTISRFDLGRIITPLRLIFWGGLLCVLDFTFTFGHVDGGGFVLDVLNDLVGAIMITVGVFRLAEVRVNDAYARAMTFVWVACVLACISAINSHFIYDVPPLVGFVVVLISLIGLAATVVFCSAMHWLSIQAGLTMSSASWKTTRLLFVVIYIIPLGLLYFAGLVAIVAGESFYFNLGPAGLLLIPVFVVPLIHFFVSTTRMKTEAQRLSNQPAIEEERPGL